MLGLSFWVSELKGVSGEAVIARCDSFEKNNI